MATNKNNNEKKTYISCKSFFIFFQQLFFEVKAKRQVQMKLFGLKPSEAIMPRHISIHDFFSFFYQVPPFCNFLINSAPVSLPFTVILLKAYTLSPIVTPLFLITKAILNPTSFANFIASSELVPKG